MVRLNDLVTTLLTMSKTYTKREIAHLLNCSVSTIERDCSYLNIEPTEGDRGMNLYDAKQFNLLGQMREHCQDKSNSRESFIPNTEVEILDIEPQVSKLRTQNSELRTYYEQAIDLGLQQDPLFDLELLQRISDRNYLLPATRLAPIFGISAKYLNSKKQYYYCGFIAIKEVYATGRALWKVAANRD
jgi:DNA-binding transcriptional MocR family regulator